MMVMQNLLSVLMGFVLLLGLFQSCKDKTDECPCRICDECIDGKCVLRENNYYLNNQCVKGSYLYHGVVESNSCVDTLVFTLNLSDPDPNVHFGLYATVPLWGAINVQPDLISKISDKEYLMGSVVTICRQNGKEWYASSIRCIIEPDSVLMKIRFRERFDVTDVYVDSCEVTLYH